MAEDPTPDPTPNQAPRPVPDPDVRFSLANERTLLAYHRTGIGLLAGAVAVAHFVDGTVSVLLAVVFCATAVVAVVGGYLQYQRNDRAIEAGDRAPRGATVHVLSLTMMLCVLVVAAYLVTDRA